MDKNLCSCFILEVCEQDGSEYPLHHIICGIMRYLRSAWYRFFQGYCIQRSKIDSVKRNRVQATASWATLRRRGRNQASLVVDTVLFMSGVYFALHSGHEKGRGHTSDTRKMCRKTTLEVSKASKKLLFITKTKLIPVDVSLSLRCGEAQAKPATGFSNFREWPVSKNVLPCGWWLALYVITANSSHSVVEHT